MKSSAPGRLNVRQPRPRVQSLCTSVSSRSSTSVRTCLRERGRAVGVASGPLKCSGSDAHLSLPARTVAAHSACCAGPAASNAACTSQTSAEPASGVQAGGHLLSVQSPALMLPSMLRCPVRTGAQAWGLPRVYKDLDTHAGTCWRAQGAAPRMRGQVRQQAVGGRVRVLAHFVLQVPPLLQVPAHHGAPHLWSAAACV